MTDAYRSELTGLQEKAARLEAELRERDEEIARLRKRVQEEDAVFTRLQGVLEDKRRKPTRRGLAVGSCVAAVLALIGGWTFARHARTAPGPSSTAPDSTPPHEANAADLPPPDEALGTCSELGVRFTIGNDDVRAKAKGPRDLAGHKYRRGGSRSPWLDVQGDPVYVAIRGDYLPGDLGTTKITLLTVHTQGDATSYVLANGGRSLLQVTRSDGKLIAGRFEVDVSRVQNATSPAPFGTPVERMRGTFCLPAQPADPNDTGP